MITWEDYPAISTLREEEGAVQVQLTVGADGAVTSCKVTGSSGHVALDEQTCALFRARAMFEPATDAQGRAVSGEISQRVMWRLEGKKTEPMPRQAWTVRTIVSLASDGTIISCRVDTADTKVGPDDCEGLVEMMKEAGRAAEPESNVAGEAITEVKFYPLLPSKLPTISKIDDATEVAQQISEVEISAEGKVTQCRGTKYTGAASPEREGCNWLRHMRFVPVGDGNPTAGTLVLTAYHRQHATT
jgi:TonB family protein